jgi:hypothetical protein
MVRILSQKGAEKRWLAQSRGNLDLMGLSVHLRRKLTGSAQDRNPGFPSLLCSGK